MLRINDRVVIPEEELRWSFARSGGPGGQNVNKVSSKVLLRWNPRATAALPPEVRARLAARLGSRLTREGDLLVVSQRFRDQPQNIEDCREKLRELVRAMLHTPRPRRATRPTRASSERRLTEKRRRAETKGQRRRVEE